MVDSNLNQAEAPNVVLHTKTPTSFLQSLPKSKRTKDQCGKKNFIQESCTAGTASLPRGACEAFANICEGSNDLERSAPTSALTNASNKCHASSNKCLTDYNSN